jgi:hypothetical protein
MLGLHFRQSAPQEIWAGFPQSAHQEMLEGKGSEQEAVGLVGVLVGNALVVVRAWSKSCPSESKILSRLL